MIEPLFYEQPNDAIGVEEKVTAARCFVSDNRVERFELGSLG